MGKQHRLDKALLFAAHRRGYANPGKPGSPLFPAIANSRHRPQVNDRLNNLSMGELKQMRDDFFRHRSLINRRLGLD